MAGIRITQLRPQHATGRRYGSFVGKPTGGGLGHPVGRITQLHPQMATGRRYRSFGGKPDTSAPTVGVATYIPTFRPRRR